MQQRRQKPRIDETLIILICVAEAVQTPAMIVLWISIAFGGLMLNLTRLRDSSAWLTRTLDVQFRHLYEFSLKYFQLGINKILQLPHGIV